MNLKILIRWLVFYLILAPVAQIWACTGIMLKSEDGAHIHARTLEFGVDLKSKVLFIPRNYALQGLTDNLQLPGLHWSSKYAVLGINAFGQEAYIDGVNEKGLAGGLFYFPGFAKYQELGTELDYHKSLPIWQVLTWILTNFANVDEALALLPKIYVTDVALSEFGSSVPAHLIVRDQSGKSVVIEYIDGRLKLYENQLGVITNSPNFDWHLTNLRNYINLSNLNSKTDQILGLELRQLGQGSGMLGLPGDFTSPSRFVRAAQFVRFAPTSKTALESVYQAFRILNNFDIPKGSIVAADGTVEFTLWTDAIDLKNQTLYFRNYDNFQLQKFELNQFDLNAKNTQQFDLVYPDKIVDRLSEAKRGKDCE